MIRRMAVGVWLALMLAALGACSTPRAPLVVEDGIVALENQTAHEWRNVKIVVNDHFGGGVASLAPGGRMTAPLTQFQTAFGQKFDRGRQSVFKVEVTATDAEGKPVTLTWTGDKPKP